MSEHKISTSIFTIRLMRNRRIFFAFTQGDKNPPKTTSEKCSKFLNQFEKPTSKIYIYKTQSLSVCLSAIEIKLETFRYKQTYESYITFFRESKYGILISIRIVYGGLRAYIYSTYCILKIWLFIFNQSLHFTRSTTGKSAMVIQCKNLISLHILPDQRRVNLLVPYKISRCNAESRNKGT